MASPVPTSALTHPPPLLDYAALTQPTTPLPRAAAAEFRLLRPSRKTTPTPLSNFPALRPRLHPDSRYPTVQLLTGYLDDTGGVRVYRDGIRVYNGGEQGDDWLGLDLRRVNIPTRRISRNIILGAVHLSLEQSSGLIEKTNNGDLKDPDKLVEEINDFFHQQQIAAILNWEKRVSDATADTVSAIFSLATTSSNAQERGKDVGRLLARLSVEAVGKDHVEQDRFRAVNEALLPILADRIAAMRSPESDNEIWQGAFDSSDAENAFSLEEAARLNSQVHMASVESNQGTERGAVIELPDELSSEFEQTFGLTQEVAANKQFRCKDFSQGQNALRWALVQCQAVCDYVQTQPGPLPYYLGLELPEPFISKSGKSPAALWTSPPFYRHDAIRYLHVNARFQISLPNSEAEEALPLPICAVPAALEFPRVALPCGLPPGINAAVSVRHPSQQHPGHVPEGDSQELEETVSTPRSVTRDACESRFPAQANEAETSGHIQPPA